MSNEVVIAKHNIDQEPNTPTKYGLEVFQQCFCLKQENLKQPKLVLLQIKYCFLDKRKYLIHT